MGPVFGEAPNASTALVSGILESHIPLIPEIELTFIDVRDCAEAHINAMTSPEAAGKRHLLSAEVISTLCISRLLNDEFKSHGFSVPAGKAPHWVWKLLSTVNKRMKLVLPMIGRKVHVTSTCMNYLLEHKPIGSKESLIAMGQTMIEKGMLKSKRKQ